VPYLFGQVYGAAGRMAESEGTAGPFDKAVDVAARSPSLKLKRRAIETAYAVEVAALYC
jgi:hypothetical protein